MKILASIYAESNDHDKRDKAKEFLKKVTQHDTHDIDSWIQLAEILEGVDLQGIEKKKHKFFLKILELI
jgi:hypothetical protein